MRTKKFGRLTPEEVDFYFHYDFSQFPRIEEYWCLPLGEYKVTECRQCLRWISHLENELENNEIRRYKHEPKYEEIRLFGDEAKLRFSELVEYYSKEPQECRLFDRSEYYPKGTKRWFAKGVEVPETIPLEFQSKSWTGATVVEFTRDFTVEKKTWLCPYCLFSILCDYIVADYSIYEVEDTLPAPHTENKDFYEFVVVFLEKFFDEPVRDWIRYDRKPGVKRFIVDRANRELDAKQYKIFKLWVEGHQQQQIADEIYKSIGYVNTRLRKIREGPMGTWYEEYFKGKGNRAGHGEPDLIEDGIPINLKITGSKSTTRIKREKLDPEISYAKTHSTNVLVRVYNIVHDKTQELEFKPLEIPIEILVEW